MNKESLVTILGAVLLGLAKSKIGNRNEEEHWINFVPYQSGLDANAQISFGLSVSAERPKTYTDADIEAFRDAAKRQVFDENSFLDDDDEEKQDWDEASDVPDWHVDAYVEEHQQELEEDMWEAIGEKISECTYQVIEKIKEQLQEDPNFDDDEFFYELRKLKRKKDIEIYLEPYDTSHEAMYNDSDDITVIMHIRMYLEVENPAILQLFYHGLDTYLTNDLADEYLDCADGTVECFSGPDIDWSNFKSTKSKLRRR